MKAAVLFAGAGSGFERLDQANLRLTRTLAGRGEVEVILMVDGKLANVATCSFK